MYSISTITIVVMIIIIIYLSNACFLQKWRIM